MKRFIRKFFKSPPEDQPKPSSQQGLPDKLSVLSRPLSEALLSMYQGDPQSGTDGSRHQIDGITRISAEQGLLIHDLIVDRKSEDIVEIGMAYGFSSLFILAALARNGKGRHTAIDPFQESDWKGIGLTHAIMHAPHFGGETCFTFHADRSDRKAADFARAGRRFDLIFIDGNHRYDDVLVDFYLYAQLCSIGGLIIFDDMWMKSIRTVCNFIRANRTDFREVASPVGNVSIFEKVAEDTRDWNDFKDFEVAT